MKVERSSGKERDMDMTRVLVADARSFESRLMAGLALLLACCLVASNMGCKASAAKATGFTQADMMTHDPSLPFHKVWRKPGTDLRNYNKLYVAPVNTEYMLQNTDWQKGERKKQIEADVKELATYTRQSIEKAFKEDPKHHFQVLDAPAAGDPKALTFEVAITEVVPSKTVLNALGYAPFGIGMAISAVRMVAKDQSTAAFEARVRDASTNEVIAMLADRESEQFAPVSVRGLTWYSHAKTMIDQWSKQFVAVANREPGQKVKDTDTITLKPW
jgi:hypothetical protein